MGGVEDVGEQEADELERERDEQVPGEAKEVSDRETVEEEIVAGSREGSEGTWERGNNQEARSETPCGERWGGRDVPSWGATTLCSQYVGTASRRA